MSQQEQLEASGARKCKLCEVPLEGDYWCVAVHREREDPGGVRVLFADEALSVCRRCVPTYSRAWLVALASGTAAEEEIKARRAELGRVFPQSAGQNAQRDG